jgi:site-specific recombinase XerD
MMNSEWRFDAEAHGLNPGSVEPYLMDFAAKLAASGYTRLSINDYAISIAHFGDWLRRKGMPVEAVDEKVLARFKIHHCCCFGIRSKKRLSGRYLKRVRRFMCHLAARGVVAWNARAASRPASDQTVQVQNVGA